MEGKSNPRTPSVLEIEEPTKSPDDSLAIGAIGTTSSLDSSLLVPTVSDPIAVRMTSMENLLINFTTTVSASFREVNYNVSLSDSILSPLLSFSRYHCFFSRKFPFCLA